MSSNRFRFTNAKLRSLVYPRSFKKDKPYIVHDTEQRSLKLRVYPTGSKAFLFRMSHEGIPHRRTLGAFGHELTVEQARKKVEELRAEIKYGLPVNEAVDTRKNVHSLAKKFIRYRVSKLRSKVDYERRLGLITERWGDRRPELIRREEVREWHYEIAKRAPYEANRCLEALKALLRWGEQQNLVEKGASDACTVDRASERPRRTILSSIERTRLAEAIAADRDPTTRALFRIYLDIPIRKSELLRARWADVDLDSDAPVLRLFAESDYKRVHPQPLLAHHVELLRAVPRVEGNPYIFVSRDGTSHRKRITRAWNRLRKAAGIEHVRLHDLRRTTATLMAERGASAFQIQQALADSTQTAARHYVQASAEVNREIYSRLAEETRKKEKK